jgi:NADPH-dependent glutamate synthase beta subunit-like oxidoreductase
MVAILAALPHQIGELAFRVAAQARRIGNSVADARSRRSFEKVCVIHAGPRLR